MLPVTGQTMCGALRPIRGPALGGRQGHTGQQAPEDAEVNRQLQPHLGGGPRARGGCSWQPTYGSLLLPGPYSAIFVPPSL